jgi:hypothetical protein
MNEALVNAIRREIAAVSAGLDEMKEVAKDCVADHARRAAVAARMRELDTRLRELQSNLAACAPQSRRR